MGNITKRENHALVQDRISTIIAAPNVTAKASALRRGGFRYTTSAMLQDNVHKERSMARARMKINIQNDDIGYDRDAVDLGVLEKNIKLCDMLLERLDLDLYPNKKESVRGLKLDSLVKILESLRHCCRGEPDLDHVANRFLRDVAILAIALRKHCIFTRNTANMYHLCQKNATAGLYASCARSWNDLRSASQSCHSMTERRERSRMTAVTMFRTSSNVQKPVLRFANQNLETVKIYYIGPNSKMKNEPDFKNRHAPICPSKIKRGLYSRCAKFACNRYTSGKRCIIKQMAIQRCFPGVVHFNRQLPWTTSSTSKTIRTLLPPMWTDDKTATVKRTKRNTARVLPSGSKPLLVPWHLQFSLAVIASVPALACIFRFASASQWYEKHDD